MDGFIYILKYEFCYIYLTISRNFSTFIPYLKIWESLKLHEIPISSKTA